MGNTISYEQMYALSPCSPYQTDEVKAIFKSYLGDGKPILDILFDETFPVAADQNVHEDKIWLISHFLSNKTNRLFAVACCKQIWHLMSDVCKQTVNVAEKFAVGNATIKELSDAWAAAWAAADAAADAAARAAARSAARSAVWAAQIQLLIQTIETHGY